jgi:hypothetical protein
MADQFQLWNDTLRDLLAVKLFHVRTKEIQSPISVDSSLIPPFGIPAAEGVSSLDLLFASPKAGGLCPAGASGPVGRHCHFSHQVLIIYQPASGYITIP